MVAPLIDTLAALKPDIILHSDRARTRAVAEPLARRLGVDCSAEPLWRERNFGSWEGQSWNAIYRATGNAMDGMVDNPAGFRPGDDGETTAELVRRTLVAMRKIPSGKSVVIISHGGPIAAARMLADQGRFEDLAQLIIRPGIAIQIDRARLARAVATPCIRLCTLDGRKTRCTGCLRTTEEIALWTQLDIQAKNRLLVSLNDRKGQNL
jgi:broad specificity phosphatase PhoE